MNFFQFQSFSLLAFLISGCSTLQLSLNIEQEKQLYRQAITDATVIESCEIKTLPLINEPRVKVVTWTNFPDSYIEGQEIAVNWGELWVTLDNDVKSRCQQFTQEHLVGDIQKLLGLPLNSTEKRNFVILDVDAKSLFRPCANPSLQADRCTATFPEGVTQDHYKWFAEQTARSYQMQSGFPWTRLGYTYNWKEGESEVGVAEFVVKKGSKVFAISVVETASYCSKGQLY